MFRRSTDFQVYNRLNLCFKHPHYILNGSIFMLKIEFPLFLAKLTQMLGKNLNSIQKITRYIKFVTQEDRQPLI